jgi:hypothetical protein
MPACEQLAAAPELAGPAAVLLDELLPQATSPVPTAAAIAAIRIRRMETAPTRRGNVAWTR